MKFKHTFHVFVDNFNVVYKQLVYRLAVTLIATLFYSLCLSPLLIKLTGSAPFKNIMDGVFGESGFLINFLNGQFETIPAISDKIKTAFDELIKLFQSEMGTISLTAALMILVYLVERWFEGLGNYATAAVINDKMALRANSHFLATLIRNLKTAAIYNAIYVPLSVLYDACIAIAMFFLLYALVMFSGLPFLLAIFFFTLVLVISITFKMTLTTDWLPALIRGKKTQKQAFIYTFSRKDKGTLNVLSNFNVLVLLIFSVNVLAAISTLGVGLLVTVPASYVLLICFEMINYYDTNSLKYSIGDNQMIVPAREHVPTREEFFRGEDD